MKRFFVRLARGFGRGLKNGLVAVGALAFLGSVVAIADYSATQGSGTTFASVVISSVHYAAHVICDATVGETQCAAVSTHGELQIDTPTTNSNLYSALTAPMPCLNSTAYNTNSYSTGQTNPVGCDLNGNLYTNTRVATTDPCANPSNTKTFTNINVSASGLDTTPIVTATSAKRTYICQFIINNNAAESAGIFETATAGSCAGTDVGGIWGAATHSSSAAGFNFAANGGVSIGSGGSTVGKTANVNTDVCLIQSVATQLTGGVLWVQQ